MPTSEKCPVTLQVALPFSPVPPLAPPAGPPVAPRSDRDAEAPPPREPERDSSDDRAAAATPPPRPLPPGDRHSTRLNSSHSQKSYADLCLKKKNSGATASD